MVPSKWQTTQSAISISSVSSDLLSVLTKVVDVVDGDAGTVVLRRKVEDYDEMALDTRSTRTAPAGRTPLAPVVRPAGTAPDV